MRRIVALLLFCLLLLLVLSASADELRGQTGELSWVLDDSGTLTISGEGKTQDFTGSNTSSSWKPYNDRIRKIVIENGVTRIGWNAFSGCTNLTEVILPDSLKVISLKAFMDCSSLTVIRIPAGVTEIGDRAFWNCGAPSGVVTVGVSFETGTECRRYFEQRSVVLQVTSGSFAEEYAIRNDMSYDNGSGIVLCENSQLLDKTDAIIAECIREGMTEEQKAQALHNWIVRHASYGANLARTSPAAPILLDGKGVCVDYAYAYSLLLSRADLANYIISGEANGDSHSWNLVRIDGRWYHVDVTWDDGTGTSNYFMLSDRQMRRDHVWDQDLASADNAIFFFGYFDPDR